MRLTDILKPGCVKVPLKAQQKQQAIEELVDLLCDQTGIGERQQLKAAVWQREQTRTTGIGHGVAIPHAKIKDCPGLVMAIGKADPAIDFAAIDGKPVDLVFLLASPVDQTGPHIQALAAISRMLTDADLRGSLKRAASAADLYKCISDYEASLPVNK